MARDGQGYPRRRRDMMMMMMMIYIPMQIFAHTHTQIVQKQYPYLIPLLAQSAAAVEYTDFFSAEG